jgi:hypothetical protein
MSYAAHVEKDALFPLTPAALEMRDAQRPRRAGGSFAAEDEATAATAYQHADRDIDVAVVGDGDRAGGGCPRTRPFDSALLKKPQSRRHGRDQRRHTEQASHVPAILRIDARLFKAVALRRGGNLAPLDER